MTARATSTNGPRQPTTGRRIWAAGLRLAAFLAAAAVSQYGWAATVQEVTIASMPGDGVYSTVAGDDQIEIKVEFDTAVHVMGQPTFELVVGRESKEMGFLDGSGTEFLSFRYTVQPDDFDNDGISYPANALRGGTITDNDDATRSGPVVRRRRAGRRTPCGRRRP